MAVLKVAKENNVRIPEDMKIVGYDDIPYSRLSNPTISTVKSNAHKVGAEAAKRVLSATIALFSHSSRPFQVHDKRCS